MKHCPGCDAELVKEAYEGVAVWRCAKCRGALLPKYKLEMIRHQREREPDALKREAAAEFTGDTQRMIRCPRCGAHMEKRPLAGPYARLTMDYCHSCTCVWLDGGELAIAQLIFEDSGRGRDSLERKHRMAELDADPERRARFEADLARMPEELPGETRDQPPELIIADKLLEAILRAVIR